MQKLSLCMRKLKHTSLCLLLFLGGIHGLLASTNWDTALDALKTGNYPLADSLFKQIIDEFPNRPEAHLYKAQSSYWLGHYETALYHLNLSDPPVEQKGKAEMLRAYCYNALGEENKAHELMKDIVVDYVPLRDSARAFLVNYYIRTENYHEALNILAQRIADNPRPGLYAMRAEVALYTRDMEGAIDDFSSAIALDPRRADFFQRRAIIYGERGQHNQAILDYDQAILLDPDNDTLWRFRLAESLSANQYELALNDLGKLIARYPRDIELREWKFECYLNLEQYENASLELEIIEQHDSDNWLLKQYDSSELLARSRMGRLGHFLKKIIQILRREWVFWIPSILFISLITFAFKRRSRRASS